MTRKHAISRPFIFPVGIIKRSNDILDIGAHLSDARAFIFRVKGLEQLMKRIIATDQMAQSFESP